MEALLAALEGTAPAAGLRTARWGYAALNAGHILGMALLVGASTPLNLRLMGLWRTVPRETVVRVLAPVAATGLGLAVATGLLLFSVRAREYSGIGFLQLKLTLVAVGALSILMLTRRHGFLLTGASDARVAVHATISMMCWLGALVCGRLIAFAGD